jgi:hypothetical protein
MDACARDPIPPFFPVLHVTAVMTSQGCTIPNTTSCLISTLPEFLHLYPEARRRGESTEWYNLRDLEGHKLLSLVR